jgi:hypothetical protein
MKNLYDLRGAACFYVEATGRWHLYQNGTLVLSSCLLDAATGLNEAYSEAQRRGLKPVAEL